YPDTSFIPTQQFTFGGAMKHDIFSFSIQWNGQLRPAESGDYTISLLHDDHVRFTYCGQPLLDANHGDSPLKSEARISLKRGEHYPIELEYRHDGGDTARIKFCCEKIDEPNGPTVLSTEMMGKYYAGPEYNVLMAERVDAQIDFTWNAGSPPHPIFQQQPMIPLIWPQGVRRYSYRRDPELPAGNAPMHDNVQIAFNVLAEEDKELLPHPPGVPKGFTNYQCSDYEYALNPVAEQFGGGVEIWRLRKPGLPHKHYYPRQPSSPREGAVADGQLVVRREGQTRIVEMALPWDEIPVVHQRLLAGKTIKFSYRVNDNGSSGTMELARGRSVSKLNPSFYVDWREHWANELEFYFEKK
ncbi:MAG: hypothetical protein EHM72_19745, partial [Calditrichaeota bacterium]